MPDEQRDPAPFHHETHAVKAAVIKLAVPLGPVALAFDGVMKVDELCPDNHSLSATTSNIAVRKRLRNRIHFGFDEWLPRSQAAA